MTGPGTEKSGGLSGILPVFKPEGFTSFDVIAKLRGILRTRRLGHAGTLDPMATGVLPVFAGLATKACDLLPDSDKSYIAGFRLGISTDTQDSTGTVLSQRPFSFVTPQGLEAALAPLRGEILQLPPMYSAVSVGGKRLYELARQGLEVERAPRPVTIRALTLSGYDARTGEGELEISCSKGTYIRTLIHDLGEGLGCGGIMTSLVRTKAAGFTLEECVTLDTLQSRGGDFQSLLIPVERLFEALPAIRLCEAQARMYKNGVKLDLNRLDIPRDSGRFRVFGESGSGTDSPEFLGTAYADFEKGQLRTEKNFFER